PSSKVSMFTRPAYCPILVGIWIVPLLIGILIGPPPKWWILYLPPPALSAVDLQNARILDLAGGPCYSWQYDDWETVARSPAGKSWFVAMARDTLSPVGRFYGWLGLYYLSGGREPDLVHIFPRPASTGSVRVALAPSAESVLLPLSSLLARPGI